MRTDHRTDAAGGPALFRLVRYWSRRWPRQATGAAAFEDQKVGRILILEAIDACRDPAGGAAAISDVADELGLDRSNASRMLAEAVTAGLVMKAAASDDARKAELRITSAGHQLLGSARAWQQAQFEQMVAGWPDEDARRLTVLLTRLADETSTRLREDA